jgi:hypothetical protein
VDFAFADFSYQSEKLLNGLPSSFKAIACVRDIWASRSKRRTRFDFGNEAIDPSAHVVVVFPTPPLKLIVAIVFISQVSWLASVLFAGMR